MQSIKDDFGIVKLGLLTEEEPDISFKLCSVNAKFKL